MPWRVALALLAGIAVAVPVGCCTSRCTNEPLIRQEQLLEQSEDSLPDGEKWRRGADWMGDQPSHMKPGRIIGGIM